MKSELDLVLRELAQYFIYGTEDVKNAYKGEKIAKLDKKITDINKVYRNFQKIEKDNYWKMDTDEIFYRQAKYLENFEDNYEIKNVHRSSYHIFGVDYTYSNFSFADFRTYFSWRTKIRKGKFELIEWEYEQIYINELLNQIGCKDETDAMEKLIDFWKGYRQCTLRIDSVMPNIIKEFYIISGLKILYTEIMKKFPIEIKTQAKDLKDINKGIYTDKIEFLNKISTYKISKSKLLKTKYGYLLNQCIEKVFNRLNSKFKENDILLAEMLMYKNQTDYWWEPLKNYNIFYKKEPTNPIIIEGTEKYECKNGVWNRIIYSENREYKNTIGYILKTMECYIREYLGYRKLKLPEKTEIVRDIGEYYCLDKTRNVLQKIYKMNLQEIIQIETIKFLEENKIPKKILKKPKEKKDEFEQEEKIEVVFNQEQFAKIREKSEEIQKALIIEENDTEIANNMERKEVIKNNEKISGIKKDTIDRPKEVASTQDEIEKTSANIKLSEQIELQENSNNIIEENVFKKFAYNLNPEEKEIINTLLEKQDVENKIMQIAQRQNEMLEVIISNINDKALETIGDTVIESNMSSIYEDYEEEIKQAL